MAKRQSYRIINRPTPTIIGAGITEQYYFYHIRSLFGCHVRLKPHFFGSENFTTIQKRIDEVLNGNGLAICVFDTDVANRDEKENKKLKSLLKKY